MRDNSTGTLRPGGSRKGHGAKRLPKGTGAGRARSLARGLQVLLLAAGLVLAQTAPARAVDFRVVGEWVMNFDYGQNGNFTGGNGQIGYNGRQDEFDAKQRLRIQVDALVSEYLSGTVYFEIGDTTWGNARTGGALGTDQTIIEVRRAYIDWTVPNTQLKVRMGLQGAIVPSYAMVKPQSLGDDFTAVSFSWQFHENVGVSGFWGRLYNDNFAGHPDGRGGFTSANYLDNMDTFVLTLPVTFDMGKVTPWVMYTAIGPNAFKGYGENGEFDGKNYGNFSNATGVSGPWITRGLLPAWANMGILRGADKAFDSYGNGFWAGVTGDITVMDALRIAWDFTYGTVSFDSSAFNRQGWMGALLVEYAFDWGTPGIAAWYATGDDANLGNGSERLPSISTGAMDNVFSNYALDGKVYIGRDAAMFNNLAGSWAVGVRVRDVSFLENLTHIFRVYYIGGTNSAGILDEARRRGFNPTPNNFDGQAYGVENMYLTDHDSAMEFGVTSVYKMYENLKIALDVGYIALWLDKSEDVWGSSKINGRDDTTRDAWNANLMFLYSF